MFLLSLLQLWHHILRFSLQAELTFLRDQVKDPPLLKEIVKERNIKSPDFDSNQTHDNLFMMRGLYHYATISPALFPFLLTILSFNYSSLQRKEKMVQKWHYF